MLTHKLVNTFIYLTIYFFQTGFLLKTSIARLKLSISYSLYIWPEESIFEMDSYEKYANILSVK